MSIKKLIICFILFSILLFSNCGKKLSIISVTKQGHLDKLIVRSTALADNTTGERNEKTIYVFLPPGYNSAKEHYPVIYYLHGYGADSTEFLSFEDSLFKAMEEKKSTPFILVAVNCNTSLGGSFYINSPYTGRWEDHIVKELVTLIDRRYRTLNTASSRGIMGFSMGGFGAINLGLSHPDVFGAVWALCPGVFVPGKGLAAAMPQWKRFGGSFLDSYAQAFSKEKKIPLLDGSVADNAVIAEWEAGFGNWEKKIDRYKKAGINLRGIRMIYGEVDFFTWITEGTQYLGGVMKQEGLPVEVQGYNIEHAIRAEIVRNDALLFFMRILDHP
jgi:predicted esterase